MLRAARDESGVSLDDISREIHLSREEMESLEEDCPVNPRLARLHAVTYARYLGLDPASIRQSLPPLPELTPKHQHYLSNTLIQPKVHRRSSWEAFAPMGKGVLCFLLAATLLSIWGMVRQLSRVRAVPWVTTTYTLHDLPAR